MAKILRAAICIFHSCLPTRGRSSTMKRDNNSTVGLPQATHYQQYPRPLTAGRNHFLPASWRQFLLFKHITPDCISSFLLAHITPDCISKAAPVLQHMYVRSTSKVWSLGGSRLTAFQSGPTYV